MSIYHIELGSTRSADYIGIYPHAPKELLIDISQVVGEEQRGRLSLVKPEIGKPYNELGITPPVGGEQDQAERQKALIGAQVRLIVMLVEQGHGVALKPGIRHLGPGSDLFEDRRPPLG